MSLLGELQRRNVLRAAALYLAAAWLLVQIATQVLPFFEIPNSTVRGILVVLAIGLPFWLLFAWLYELTPDGLKRETPAAPDVPAAPRPLNRKLDFWIVGVVAAAMIMLLASNLMRPAGAPATVAASAKPEVIRAAPARSIAVLPFENMSDDAKNAYFTDGVQELILTRLAGIGGLGVVSRTSTEKYKSRPDNLRQIAAELGVAHILEGSVQKAGNQVLITVQLIEADSDKHLWAEAYQRTLDDIFGVEGEVAQKVADALKTRLTPAETARLADKPTRNAAAYDLFLRAEYFANRGFIDFDTAALKQAIPLYRQAVQQDPDFALALAKLSHAESLVTWFGADQLDAQARTDAERALALQPDLPEAHLAIGYCDYLGRGDYEAALKAFDSALARRPSDADALAARGYVLRRQGKLDDAIQSLRQAQALDPRNTSRSYDLGRTCMMAARYAEAEAALEHALALDPGNVNAKVQYSNAILFDSGDIARAERAVEGDAPDLRRQRLTLLAYQRRYDEAITLVQGMPDTPDNFSAGSPSKALILGELHRLLGDKAAAEPLFKQGLEQAQAQLAAQNDGNPVTSSRIRQTIADAQLGLGQLNEAMDSIAESEKLLAGSGDHVSAAYIQQFNAGLYAQAGRADLAVQLLEQALSEPGSGGDYAPVMLWLDPVWDPIRDDPAFHALQARHADGVPVAIRSDDSSPGMSAEAKK